MCFYKALMSNLTRLLFIILLCSSCKRSSFTSPYCSNGETQCNGNTVERCRDGAFTIWDDCNNRGQVCVMSGTEARCSNVNSITGKNSDSDVDSDSDTDGDSDGDSDSDSDLDSDGDSDYYHDNDSDSDSEIPIASAWQKENICGCLHKIFDATQELLWMKTGCINTITDACVACVDRKTNSASCADLNYESITMTMAQCSNVCLSALVPPADTKQCKEVIGLYPTALFRGSSTIRDYYSSCMCNNCLGEVSACLVDFRCLSPSLCILEIGDNCKGEECLNTGCRDVIQWAASVNPDSIDMISAVIECAYRHNSCVPELDAGLDDSGPDSFVPDAGGDAGNS